MAALFLNLALWFLMSGGNYTFIKDEKGKFFCGISRHVILERVRPYGFIECGAILDFLQLICVTPPGLSDLAYIREKIKECLGVHDNGSDYFKDLKRLVRDIDDEVLYRISSPDLPAGK